MSWFEMIIPAVIVALLVRLDALLVGPYWAFLDLLSELSERASIRRHTIVRRFLIPVVVGGVFEAIRSSRSSLDAGIIGVVGAGFLIWPMIFTGLPRFVSATDWQVPVLYAAVVGAFFLGGFLGSEAAGFFRELVTSGQFLAYLRERWAEFLVGLILSVLLLTIQDRTSARLEQRRKHRADRRAR
jgi:hypothetical protein